MDFIINLIRDYKKGYGIVIKKYKNFIPDFILASILIIVIAMLHAGLPYILRLIVNEASLPELTIPNLLLLLGAAYGIGWTISEVLEWIKNIYSSKISTKINAAIHNTLYEHIIRVKYPIILQQSPGKLISFINRSRSSFSSFTYTFFWIIIPVLIQVTLSICIVLNIVGGVFAIFLLLSLIVLSIVTTYLASISKNIYSDIFQSEDLLSSHLVDKLQFIQDIKLNNAYLKERDILSKILDKYTKTTIEANK